MGRILLWMLSILLFQSHVVKASAINRETRHHVVKRCAPESRECCAFPQGSVQFSDCCNKYQCCPLCANLFAQPCNATLAQEECCQYNQSKQEFNDCCDKHGCCPLCDREVRPDCDWLAAKKDCCPLPVPSTAFDNCCMQYGCCPSCEGCIDDNGTFNDERTGWPDPDDPCIHYYCMNGIIITDTILCLRPPCEYPYSVPGECCPHCDGCYDQYGTYHESMTSWIDPENPCIYHYCENGLISSSISKCARPPCQFPVSVPGECCPICDGCYDEHGVYHQSMTSWPDLQDPCLDYSCCKGKITKHVRDCPPVECQNPIKRPCECCPYCIEDGHSGHGGHHSKYGKGFPGINLDISMSQVMNNGPKENDARAARGRIIG